MNGVEHNSDVNTLARQCTVGRHAFLKRHCDLPLLLYPKLRENATLCDCHSVKSFISILLFPLNLSVEDCIYRCEWKLQ